MASLRYFDTWDGLKVHPPSSLVLTSPFTGFREEGFDLKGKAAASTAGISSVVVISSSFPFPFPSYLLGRDFGGSLSRPRDPAARVRLTEEGASERGEEEERKRTGLSLGMYFRVDVGDSFFFSGDDKASFFGDSKASFFGDTASFFGFRLCL